MSRQCQARSSPTVYLKNGEVHSNEVLHHFTDTEQLVWVLLHNLVFSSTLSRPLWGGSHDSQQD